MRINLLFIFMLAVIAAFGQQSPIQIDANGITQTFGAGGIVTRGQIVKINSAGQIVPMATTDTSGAIGIAATSQQNVGQVVAVSIGGSPLVQVDGACAPGNLVGVSATVGGSGHCGSAVTGQFGIALTSATNGFAQVQWTGAGGGGGIPAGNSPNLVVPGPPVFNVKNYGAFGDTQLAASASVNSTTITCATCNFSTAVDVTTPLKAVFISQGSGSFLSAWTGASIAHIVSVQSATSATTDIAANNAITGTMRWGRLDDTGFTTATTAALAAAFLTYQNQQLGIQKAAPTIYIPAGGYLLCNSVTNAAISLSPVNGNNTQVNVKGDGSGATAIYVGDGTPNPCPYSSNIPWFISTSGSITRLLLEGFTVDGGNNAVNKNVPAVGIASNLTYVHDIIVQRNNPQQQGINAPSLSVKNGGIYGDNIVVVGNGGPFLCSQCGGTIESGIFSNNGSSSSMNVAIQNVVGSSSGQGFRLGKGVLVDECGGGSACTVVTNSQDVWFIGPGLFGTTGQPCLSVDGTSVVHFNGGLCGLFLTDTNVSGPVVAAGGVLEEADVRNISSGTGKSITCTGTCLNNGSNTSESLFTIASGSESVNTVSLTVTTQGANVSTNCAIGDTAIVEGVNNPAGYSGKFKFAITAVGTNTVSYTNPTSGLTAIGAVGAFSCLHNRSVLITGVPTQTLAPSQFNCNIPTLTATTTTATTNCFFTPDRDIYVTRLSAGLGTTPATCTTAAILQVTNGTNSTNLTLTNAAAQDDSGAITGVLMSANTKIGVIVQTAASGCGTSPANAAVNFFWMAAIDN